MQSGVGRGLSLCLAAVGLSVLALPAHADVQLALVNAGFEIHDPFDKVGGCGTSAPCFNYSIVDWNQFGGSGTFAPGLDAPAIAPPAFEGQDVAYLNSARSGGSFITQDLGTLTSGVTYLISIEVASRGPAWPTPPAQYRLGAATGGDAAAPTWTTVDQISGIAPANPLVTSDNWSLATLQFTAASTGDWYVFIADDGAVGGGNAQLEVDAVPEPSTLLLLVIMMTGLALYSARSAPC